MMSTRPNPGTHAHKEAFCLMQYQDELGNVEVVWNSRDGVTPFIITTRQGRDAKHVRWEEDRYAPDHKPVPGDRIFVTLTEKRARERATAMVERFWIAESMAARYVDRDEAIAEIAKGYLEYGGGGAPDIIVVEAPAPAEGA